MLIFGFFGFFCSLMFLFILLEPSGVVLGLLCGVYCWVVVLLFQSQWVPVDWERRSIVNFYICRLSTFNIFILEIVMLIRILIKVSVIRLLGGLSKIRLTTLRKIRLLPNKHSLLWYSLILGVGKRLGNLHLILVLGVGLPDSLADCNLLLVTWGHWLFFSFCAHFHFNFYNAHKIPQI